MTMLTYVLLLTSLTFVYCGVSLPEENLDVPELIRYWGYPAESHEVLTDDGYFLTLHRIPRGNPKTDGFYYSRPTNRPVFFLQHGLLCSSSNWVTNLPSQSLGFMLADAGYDVWMGNVRGNTYSKRHVKYSLDSDEFWKFSFDEMAKYDLPAMINYALNKTGKKQLYYVGHSQGTMMAFAGLSENEELNKKIKKVYALAPVARLTHASSPITYLSYLEDGLSFFFELFGIRDFMPSAKWVQELAKTGCGYNGKVCDNVLFLIAGSDQRNMNETRTPVYLTHTPAGTSVRNMLHFCQLIQEKRFQRYDDGYISNFRKYGWYRPSEYDLKNIETEFVFFSGTHDTLADPNDVKWLVGEIPKLKHHSVLKGYNHLDFIWGLSARSKIYKKIITMTRQEKQLLENNVSY